MDNTFIYKCLSLDGETYFSLQLIKFIHKWKPINGRKYNQIYRKILLMRRLATVLLQVKKICKIYIFQKIHDNAINILCFNQLIALK